ncbi:VCBS repeat-containing protein [Aestuariivivens marinum]|uniref:VCBS repeat-containing protein n=1 Tax=Aestuariivivens marinum TaxID=2913555 RepID=UPI001F58B63F|nr:VCBS repeat-containing protein [Aestuariivivens marinum]
MRYKNTLFILLFFCLSCKKEKVKETYNSGSSTIFTLIPENHSKIRFQNTVVENLYFNFLNYSYIYNGGGVAVGDINNDGLEDIYFTSNQNTNKLYINKGNFVFEDITEKANVKDDDGWSTGVTMVDINNDGWLDIYVCKSGSLKNVELRQNKLFINQKNGTFKEEAKQYGLNQKGFSTQAYFLDYDKDGDLDMYLVNHRADFQNNIVINLELLKQITQEDSDQLFRNNNGTYVNVTQQAGVANKAWGLSASIGDFNNDNWPDIYVANDFLEPDFLYINNQDGTFTDAIKSYFKHIPTNSMGSDFADINNDLLPDLIVLDMMAADRKRGKENMATMSTENFNLMVKIGFHHQYMSNMLQLNNGEGAYSEIGQLSGIAKTDWSWAPLIADFNNDGYNDVFATNGIENDLSNQDFRHKMRQNIKNRKKVTLEEAISMMPSTKLSNYLFLNNKDYTFKDVSKDFGLDKKINSNGAAYADFDNDGDLDLVINNQSDKASIYRNNTEANYIKVVLNGNNKNRKGIGAKVFVYANGMQQVKEVYSSRGYQSSVSYNLNFGLGDNTKVDSLKVVWDENKSQTLKDINVNTQIELSFSNSESIDPIAEKTKNHFENISAESLGINYKHESVVFNDYGLQVLLPQKQSTIDNALAVADVNNDGLDDIFIGNTKDYPSALYIQLPSGKFKLSNESLFETDKKYNDNNALFFDADSDGDLDLYVATGNYSLPEHSVLLQDRLYLNDGSGNFYKGKLPKMLTVTKAIASNDFDGDGDLDLFVGGRVVPGKYPMAPESYLLENRNGSFVNVTLERGKALANLGLINDAIFSDYDNDGDKDLLIVGEWLPVTIFNNKEGTFTNTDTSLKIKSGWFQTIKAIDFDHDGDEDYFVGNYGHNNKFHPSERKPLHIYANYFDDNKSYDMALSKESQGALFPIRGKECSTQQTPFLKNKISTYSAFANSNIIDIYGEENIENALHLEVNTFSSFFIENMGNNNFEFKPLPQKAQFGPVLGFEFLDLNKDSKKEVLVIGNNYDAEVETIRYDAFRGCVLDSNCELLDGFQNFTHDDTKAIKKIKINGTTHIVLLNAGKALTFLKLIEAKLK